MVKAAKPESGRRRFAGAGAAIAGAAGSGALCGIGNPLARRCGPMQVPRAVPDLKLRAEEESDKPLGRSPVQQQAVGAMTTDE
ncbi:MAG: hypothetical protein NVS4B10_02650 [Myxococcales bacterium]